MVSTLKNRSHLSFETMSPNDVSTVLNHARTLQNAFKAGTSQPMLRGMNLGLMCESEAGESASAFRRAAEELGAHVAHIRPSLSELSTTEAVQHTARMLGRLYDAVECQGMASSLVQLVGNDAGVPVYDGLATPEHPTARLAELVGTDSSAADNRHWVLQAVLLSTLA